MEVIANGAVINRLAADLHDLSANKPATLLTAPAFNVPGHFLILILTVSIRQIQTQLSNSSSASTPMTFITR